jgi:hypothetical protein
MIEKTKKKKSKIRLGLHYCSFYNNIVRYSPDLCSKCKNNKSM